MVLMFAQKYNTNTNVVDFEQLLIGSISALPNILLLNFLITDIYGNGTELTELPRHSQLKEKARLCFPNFDPTSTLVQSNAALAWLREMPAVMVSLAAAASNSPMASMSHSGTHWILQVASLVQFSVYNTTLSTICTLISHSIFAQRCHMTEM